MTDNEKTSDMSGADGAAPGPEDAQAAARLARLVSPEAVDRMPADAEIAGVSAEGLLQQLTAGPTLQQRRRMA